MSRKAELIAGLREALERVLEEAAFVFVEPDVERDLPADGVVEAVVSVSGPIVGDLVLATTEEFSLELAANLLGKDRSEVDSRVARLDAVGETLNIVAGHFMADAYGTERHFRLGAPTVSCLDAGKSLFGIATTPIQVLADGEHPVAATFRMRESLIPGERVEQLGGAE